MDKTPLNPASVTARPMLDIQISKNKVDWFSIFNAQHMLYFSTIMGSSPAAANSTAPLFSIRVVPGGYPENQPIPALDIRMKMPEIMNQEQIDMMNRLMQRVEKKGPFTEPI